MTKKIRITVEVTVEYTPTKEFYPGCETTEDMLAVDLENANSDPFAFIDTENATWKVTGEVV